MFTAKYIIYISCLLISLDVDWFPTNLVNEIKYKKESSFGLIGATTIVSESLPSPRMTIGELFAQRLRSAKKRAKSSRTRKKVTKDFQIKKLENFEDDGHKKEHQKFETMLDEPQSEYVVGEASMDEDSYEEGTSELVTMERKFSTIDEHRPQNYGKKKGNL